jgi:peptide chain release factor subunit 1
VSGLVLAGSADFKTELSQSDMFDQRLVPTIIKVVDVSYGGENGFNQAIELSADALANTKFVQEKKLIGKYFDEIHTESGKYCYGLEDTMRALEMGAVETLIVYENLDVMHYTIRNPQTEETKEVDVMPAQEKDKQFLRDPVLGIDWEVVEKIQLVEWLTENYKKFGSQLEFVTNKSTEGAQFVKGFGGIGGILRYKLNMEQLAMLEDDDFWEDDI